MAALRLLKRLIKSPTFLVILYLGLIVYFVNIYRTVLGKRFSLPTTIVLRHPTKNWETEGLPTKLGQVTTNLEIESLPTKIGQPTANLEIEEKMAATFKLITKTVCEHRIRVMHGGTVLFQGVTIRPKLGRARVLEVKLDYPNEEDEFFQLQKGFFTMYCDGDINKAHEKLNEVREYRALAGWIASLEFANPVLTSLFPLNQSFQAGQYLAIQRAEYANVYWTIIDLLDIFIMAQHIGIQPENLNIIHIDAHPSTSLDPFWSTLFQRLINLGVDHIFTESDSVVFENLAWRYPRVNCPLLDKNLQSFEPIQPFREFVLKRFGIASRSSKRNCSQRLNVLVILRRDYQTHPRNLDGTIDRKISNEKDVISEMEENLASQLKITAAQLDTFPLKRQLELVASADIFFGMHGAAHGYSIFMAPGGAVVEIFNFNSNDNWHMEKVSTLSGHSHITWTSTDQNSYDTKTRSTTIPVGIPTKLLKRAIFKICEKL